MTDGQVGQDKSWDPEQYEGGHEYVYEYGRDVLDLLDPQPGERILDLGCGTGHLTKEIADAVGPDGTAVGIDSSAAMIAEAREAYPDVEFTVADATEFEVGDLPGVEVDDGAGDDGDAGDHRGASDAGDAGQGFDAVFSNAALHWITDQAAVTERVRAALRPGARYVAELGGAGNVAAPVDALIEAVRARGGDPAVPWYFPSVGEHATLLENHGFEPRFVRLFDRPTELDGGEAGLRNWIETFGDVLLTDLDEDERAAAVADVEDELREEWYNRTTTTWTADYRRLRFVAVAE